MLLKRSLFFCFVLSVLLPPASFCEEIKKIEPEKWATCYVESSGVKFRCNLDWPVERVEDRLTMFTISEDPFITVTITRFEGEMRFIQQLTRSFFESRNIFLENFQEEEITFAGQEARKLKAFFREEPDMRSTGYYYIHNYSLHSVLFAIYPRDKWDEYKFMIKEIADSFEPIELLVGGGQWPLEK